MRTFVKYDQQGRIVGTSRVESIPEGLAQPFLVLRPGESVVELSGGTDPAEPLAALHQRFQVDPEDRSLVPRRDVQPEARSAGRARARTGAARTGHARATTKARTKARTKTSAKVTAKVKAKPAKAPSPAEKKATTKRARRPGTGRSTPKG